MSKSKSIIMNLRFEIEYSIYREFWDVGRELLNKRTKNEILKELIKIAKEHNK